MDARVELLLDEISTLPVGQSLDFKYWRGRFQRLFAENLDGESRETLLTAYTEMLDFVERSLVSQGQDPTAFNNAREVDWRTLCLQEALQRSGTDQAEPDDLNDIVQREIAAGRMDQSSFSQLAADAATVMGKRQLAEGSKKGFLRRLFGG